MNIPLPSSLYDRFIAGKRSFKFTLSIVFLLFASAVIMGSLEYGWSEFFSEQNWRNFFLPPAIISYIILISPKLSKTDQRIVQSIQPLIELDEDKFKELIEKLLYINPLKEVAAILGGVIFGLILVLNSFEFISTWFLVYLGFMSVLTYGLLAWVVYVNLSNYDFIPKLLSQPISIDPFDITPFNSIGRQGLLLAVVFAGGITLSLIFIVEAALFWTIQFWVIYIPLILCPIIIFFSNMLPTHRVILEAKEQELNKIRQPILKLSRKILSFIEEGRDTKQLIPELNALISYEERLEKTNTWPYNFSMLRTLFFSILLPGLVIILKTIL